MDMAVIKQEHLGLEADVSEGPMTLGFAFPPKPEGA